MLSAQFAQSSASALLAQAEALLARGEIAAAIACFEAFLRLDPRHAIAHNNLGVAHFRLGAYQQAEQAFLQAVRIKSDYADAQSNLGGVLRLRGRHLEAEAVLRRALKLNPTHLLARVNLGLTLAVVGRMAEAADCFERSLEAAPNQVDALLGQARVRAAQGRFEEGESLVRRALASNHRDPNALAALPSLRQMSSADTGWLEAAQQVADSGVAPAEEALLRFAIGKYQDDVGEYQRAFASYRRANELHALAADAYVRAERERFVTDMMRCYDAGVCAGAAPGVPDSDKAVLVTGMLRSGTSLVEQIIASHPAAAGAGELDFWTHALERHATLRHEPPSAALADCLARDYLRILGHHSPKAQRVVDKATPNADLLGLIHAALPQARFIYLRRDPIDTCLSCYFQQLPSGWNFTTDLSSLAHYHREHARLMAHWRSVLPAETMLEVPYEGLVHAQEHWTRRILEFVGLDWDPRCLDFPRTPRAVSTASHWQVRQPIYRSSVRRWRHYEPFLGPLLALKDSNWSTASITA